MQFVVEGFQLGVNDVGGLLRRRFQGIPPRVGRIIGVGVMQFR
jgi:hypothetical protein